MRKLLLVYLFTHLFADVFAQKGYNTIYGKAGNCIPTEGSIIYASVGWERGKLKNGSIRPRLGLVYAQYDYAFSPPYHFSGIEAGIGFQKIRYKLGIGVDLGAFVLRGINQSGYIQGDAFLAPYLTSGKASRYFEIRLFMKMYFADLSDPELCVSPAVQLSFNLNPKRLKTIPTE